MWSHRLIQSWAASTTATSGGQACSLGLDVSIPMVIDELTDDANRGYGRIPDRLFLDEAGRVAFAGEPGPMGFRPDDLEAAITALLASYGLAALSRATGLSSAWARTACSDM